MDNRATPGSRVKIISLYVVSFLILATVVGGFIWHDLRVDYLDTLDYWKVQLSNVTDDQVRICALWLNERRTDTIAVAESSGTNLLVYAGASRGQMAQVRQRVERGMADIAAGNGFLGGAVSDGDCRIVAQTGLRPEMAQGVQEACRAVQQAGQYRVDTFGMEQGHVWLSLSAPVVAEDRASSSAPRLRRIVGAAVMVIENWRDIVPVFESERAPTRPGHTLIVWKKANEALIFSPYLSARGEPSFFRRPLNGSPFESRVARDGDVAFGEFIDDLGQPIFGVAQRIGALNYSLARKVDRNEALSGYRRRAVLEQLLGTLSFVLLGFVVAALHRHAAMRALEVRARHQEALAESEHQYRVLFESAGDGIFLMRGDRFVDCNQKALELFGCGREKLIGKTPSALSPPQQPNGHNSQEAARERMRLALEGETLHFEWQHLRLDGTPFEAEVTLTRLEIGGEAHLLALVKDVTDRKRAEEALRESEARFRTLITDARVAIGVARNGITLFVNTEYARLFGLQNPEETFGRPILDQHAPQCHEWMKDMIRRRQQGLPTPTDFESIGRRKDGSTFPMHCAISHINLADGLVTLGFLTDLTERKQAEEELRLTRFSVDHASDRIICTDSQGRILYANKAACRSLGRSREELLSLTIPEIDPLLRKEGWGAYWENLKTRGSMTFESQGVSRQGEGFPIEITTNYVEFEGREYSFAFGRDITERKRAQEERQRSLEQLRALAARLQSIREEERTRVAREIHDELGQALTVIKIDLSTLINKLVRDKKQAFAPILKEVDETVELVRKISAELRPAILDALGLVAAIEWAVEEFASRNGVKCRLDVPQDEIGIDPERATAVFRILQETLTNVARHAGATEVHVKLAKEGGSLILDIQDNGKGITEEQVSAGGSLGILGMRERASLLGGELTIQGAPRKGTTVKVRLPLAHSKQAGGAT